MHRATESARYSAEDSAPRSRSSGDAGALCKGCGRWLSGTRRPLIRTRNPSKFHLTAARVYTSFPESADCRCRQKHSGFRDRRGPALDFACARFARAHWSCAGPWILLWCLCFLLLSPPSLYFIYIFQYFFSLSRRDLLYKCSRRLLLPH